MDWFINWWNDIGRTGQILACFAMPGTLLLLVQTIMLIIGGVFGHDGDLNGDHSHDFGGHGHDLGGHDHDFGGHDHDFGGHDHDFGGHDHDFGGHDHDFGGHADLHGDGTADIHSGDSHSHVAEASGLRLFTVRGIVAFFAIGGWVGLAVWDSSRNDALAILSAVVTGGISLVFAAFVMKWAMKLQESGNISPHNAIGSIATVYIPIAPNRKSTGRVTLTLQERFVELEAYSDSDKKLQTGETVLVVGNIGNTLIVRPAAQNAKAAAAKKGG